MQRLLGLAAATALTLSATLAHAESITGYVTNINSTQNRFEVGGTLFNAAPNNTVGTPLDEIKEGDKVTVTYSTSTSGAVSNARSITMVEPAPVTLQPLAAYVKEACKAELGNYCSQVVPGQNRLLACLYANGEKLSGQCETALYQAASVLDRAISTVAYLADQCRADIDSKCADVQPGQGRIAQCLADHKGSLSQPCTQAISTVRAQLE
jgi:exonuclease VII small subunit